MKMFIKWKGEPSLNNCSLESQTTSTTSGTKHLCPWSLSPFCLNHLKNLFDNQSNIMLWRGYFLRRSWYFKCFLSYPFPLEVWRKHTHTRTQFGAKEWIKNQCKYWTVKLTSNFTIQRRNVKCVKLQAAFKAINWLLSYSIYRVLWAPGALQPLITHFSCYPNREQASLTTFYRQRIRS